MHCSRNVARQPSVYRVIRAPAARQMSLFAPSPFFPRFSQPSAPSFSHGFNDLFRMMDDFASTARTFDHFTAPAALRAATPTFQPRFDVREQDGVYELRGELPGVKNEDLEVEFTDAQTLVIRGKTEHEATRGSLPSSERTAAPAIEPTSHDTTMTGALDSATTDTVNTTATDNSDAASVRSNSSYQKPTVEDEDAAAEVQSIASSASGQATPAESVTGQQATDPQTVQATSTPQSQPTPEPQQPESRYWVSERSVGTFQRVFQFPTRVDHYNIKASLKDGLLSISIPKAQAPGVRRIAVQ